MQVYLTNPKRKKKHAEEKEIHYIKNWYKMGELRLITNFLKKSHNYSFAIYIYIYYIINFSGRIK